MKKMKWLYVLLATFLLTSCGTLMQPYQMDSKMKDIELGMNKKKVISILGKDFESAGARMTSEGSIIFETCKRLGRKIYHFKSGYCRFISFVSVLATCTVFGLLHSVCR